MTDDVINSARNTGRKVIFFSVLALAALPPVIALARGLSAGPYLAAGGGLVLLCALAARGNDAVSRLGLATALMASVMAITAVLSGHPWQLDSHMLYFAALAVLVVLVDIRALVLATLLVAVHHLTLSVTLPGLIYPAAELLVNLERALVHGVILLAEAVALVYTVWLRHRQIAQARLDQERVAGALEKARAAEAQGAQALEKAQKAEAGIKLAHNAQQMVVAALQTSLTRLAERDLSSAIETPFPKEYERLRQDFNAALRELSHTISGVAEHAVGLSDGARDVTQASDDLSRRTESQAATLEQTAAALNEITRSVKAAADGAAEVKHFVSETRDKAHASGRLIGSAASAMSGIEKQSEEITKIIGVIDEIAFQTNLLSLNAGVEAARAGEAGRGFAVVATEVRALAQRSSDAARDIKTLISGSSEQVDEGVNMVKTVGTALMEMIERVDQISGFVGDIASRAEDQAQKLDEINEGVTSLDRVTQQNAAMVEECTAAAHSFGGHAAELRASVERFNLAARPAQAPTMALPRHGWADEAANEDLLGYG